jgi:hypothetical protein
MLPGLPILEGNSKVNPKSGASVDYKKPKNPKSQAPNYK